MATGAAGRTTSPYLRIAALCLGLVAPAVPALAQSNPSEPTPARRQILVRLPAARWAGNGEVIVEPNVQIKEDDHWTGAANSLRPAPVSTRPAVPTTQATEFQTGFTRYVAPPAGLPDPILLDDAPTDDGALEELNPGERGPRAPQPVFEELFGEPEPYDCEPEYGEPFWLLDGVDGDQEPGLGTERVPFALFEIDSAKPFNNYRFRFGSFYDHTFPDRAEYFWAKTGVRGPVLPERSVDYQEFRILMEKGSGKFSTGFEVPFRWTNPEVNANHAGLGDLRLTVKTVLFEGEKLMLTQYFRTLFNTGSSKMGLGTGHIALEPGFLGRYRWGEHTWLHGEIKYQFPTGGTPVFSGQVMEYGLGVSHLLWENDSVALLPTFEVVAWSVLNGTKTDEFGVPIPTDGEHIVNVLPGLRIATDKGGDLGLVELGVSGGWAVTSEQFYSGMWRIDFRIVY